MVDELTVLLVELALEVVDVAGMVLLVLEVVVPTLVVLVSGVELELVLDVEFGEELPEEKAK